MRLASLTLKNFRCYGPEPVTVYFDDLSAFVGANGAGKTAVLMALARMFGVSNDLRRLTKDDFHVPADVKEVPGELSLELEARFEFPELLDDEAAASSVAVPECLRNIIADERDDPPQCRIRLSATWAKSAAPEGEIDSTLAWINTLDEEPSESQIHRLRSTERSLIQVFYVPAARDAIRELRAVSGTLLSRVLGYINWSEEVKASVLEMSASISDELRREGAFLNLEAKLQNCWQKLRGDSLGRPELSVAEAELGSLLRRIDAKMSHSSSLKQPLGVLSEGERSLMYFALVASALEFESTYLASADSSPETKAPALTILAVEEPENHLAPQYLSSILRTLRAIKDHRAAQVVITSHSASILRRVEPTEVRHFRVDDELGHIVRKLTLPNDEDEACKYVRGAVRAYPELYFARAIILGEGPSEEIVLPRVAEVLGLDIDPQFVAVVPLGGRHVHHFWRLLRELGTPYVTLLDLDMERVGGGWARIHQVGEELLRFGETPDKVYASLSEEEFRGMSSWSPVCPDDENLRACLEDYENYFGVYFCGPLDLDWLMLSSFRERYQSIAPGTPRPTPRKPSARQQRLRRLSRAVLGDGGSDGTTAYSEDDRELFAWYSYLFVSGSKPVAHSRALSEIAEDELRESCPPVLKRVVERVTALVE